MLIEGEVDDCGVKDELNDYRVLGALILTVQKPVEVLHVQYINEAVGVPVAPQRQVPMTQTAHKPVGVPQVQHTDKVAEIESTHAGRVAEITGDVSIILPTMLALTVSCRAAKVVAHSGYTHELVQYIVSRRASPHASGSGPRDLLRRPSSMEMPGPVRAAFLRCFLDARRGGSIFERRCSTLVEVFVSQKASLTTTCFSRRS